MALGDHAISDIDLQTTERQVYKARMTAKLQDARIARTTQRECYAMLVENALNKIYINLQKKKVREVWR